MTLLAFDPDLLRALERRSTRAIDELRSLRARYSELRGDGVVDDAMRRLASAEHDLTVVWVPTLRRLLLSGVMLWRGRITIDDPFASPVRIPISSILDHTAAPDADRIAALTRQLSMIAADPILSAEVVREMASLQSEWVGLCNELARRREILLYEAANNPARMADIARIDASLAAFAHVVQRALVPDDGCPSLGALLAPIDRLDPYAAAAVLRSLDLDSATLAMVAHHLIANATPTSANLVFASLVDDTDASVTFVGLAADRPGVFFHLATDHTLPRQVLLNATDPARVDAATVGRVLVPILDFARGWQYFPVVSDAPWRVFLADLCAPWLMQLGPMNHDWSIEPDHQRDLLAFLVGDDEAFTSMMLHSDQLRQGVLTTLASGDSHTHQEFAAWFGMFGQVVLHQRVATEQQRADDWSVLLSIASIATATIPGGAMVSVPIAVGIVALSTIPVADPEAVERDAELAREYALTGAAAAVALTLAAQHDLPTPPVPDPDSPHPALDYRERFDDWLAELPGGFDGPMANRVDRLVSALLNAASAGAAVDG